MPEITRMLSPSGNPLLLSFWLDSDKALADFTRALDIDPEYGAAYYSRATLLTKMGQEDEAAEDMRMVTHLTNVNLENFANDNNIWRSRHMQVEGLLESEMNR